ncbi:hypothetical protein GCM10020367_37610 [Streptomyces sannanensis]|uniref:Uncharacterized protein n=1 Tax=Streptomyces sannanensis TaxID=285536 RepID=A0ABP6SE01_9ACTN
MGGSVPPVDWFEQSPDLPHLIAWISELVFRHGYSPADLVVLPRAESDRRETAAFTAGWAEAVTEELPRIRREYEKRVADAYAQGQRDAQGIRRPRRRIEGPVDGAQVIPLPFTQFLEPPAVVVETEERVRRERERFDQSPGQGHMHTSALPDDERSRPHTEEEAVPGPDVLFSTQDIQVPKTPQPARKVVRGKGGRPVVPPLAGVPAQSGATAQRRASEASEPNARERKGRRLSERARALEGELSERAPEAPPESNL